MKHLIHKVFLITLPFIAICAVTARAATIVTPPKAPLQPATVAPPVTNTQSAPKITSPATQAIMPCNQTVAAVVTQAPPAAGVTSVITALPVAATMGPNYVGPTPNITAVANAIGLRAKSLTTLVTLRSGLVLTKPVGITVDYSSPAAQYRAAQSYDTCNGNRLLYNDPISGPVNSPGYAVWGKPRQLAINITLTEANPGGQPFTYTIPLKTNLDPLFDISISPMRFTMTTDCDYIGSSEIHFLWYPPDGGGKPFREKGFSANKNQPVTINEFAWTRQEASASANLLFPSQAFYEKDQNITSPLQYNIPQPTAKLLPGGGGYVGRHLKDSSGQGNCEADTAFDMTITLRTYNNL